MPRLKLPIEEKRRRATERMRVYRDTHRDAINQYAHTSYLKNHEKALKRAREYRLQNPEKVQQQQKDEYNKHREKYLAREKKKREHNPAKAREQTKLALRKMRERNPEKVNAWHREYYTTHKEKYQERQKRPHVYIATLLRTRVRQALHGVKKSAKTMELVGCPIQDLLQHLAKQFQSGMSWDNYGKWHVDHIKPCAFFDLTQASEQQRCFHYSNLQPLWARDNLSKGKRSIIY